ncbi:MAG TPA: methyltransferase domain-containing protein [Ktedonobacterales bacterium]|nr:methyltransferase domain-containing protein [Ktedonobacterales bacterium]
MTQAWTRRAEQVEIMDAGGYDGVEIRSNLADLRFFNRWFGGSRLAAMGLERIIRPEAAASAPRRITLLDVATATGDIPAYLARWCAARGIDALVEGIDNNPDVLEEARRYHTASRAVTLLRADARHLPHADRSVDVAICSNFMHHLESSHAVEALREMRRVSRAGVVIVDLMRAPMAYAGVWLLTHLTTTNRLTRNDGPLSVQRAFTPAEMMSMARKAGLDHAELRKAGPVRMLMTWRRP